MKVLNTLLILCVTAGMGCSTYLADRKKDAMDIFTLTAGKSTGVKAQAGIVHCGLYGGVDKYGLRGGTFGIMNKDCQDTDVTAILLSGHGFGKEIFKPYDKLDPRHKGYYVEYVAPLVTGITTYRGGHYGSKKYLHPRNTDVQVAAGIYYGVRVGFNVMELLDFVLGFACVDIYNDDYETWKTKCDENELMGFQDWVNSTSSTNAPTADK